MSSVIHSQTVDIPHNMTTTGFDMPGFRSWPALAWCAASWFGLDRSLARSAPACRRFSANISLFTELAERTRQQAFDTMLVQASMAGADAVIGIRYDATEVMNGVTEVLCYGTAVHVEPLER